MKIRNFYDKEDIQNSMLDNMFIIYFLTIKIKHKYLKIYNNSYIQLYILKGPSINNAIKNIT